MSISLDQEYFSPAEVQRRFSISRASFYRYLSEGKIEGVKCGRSLRIPASSIRAFFASLPKYKKGGAVIEKK